MNKDDNFNSILQTLTGNSIGADRSIFLQNAEFLVNCKYLKKSNVLKRNFKDDRYHLILPTLLYFQVNY